MKKAKIFNLFAVGLSLGFMACNSGGDSTNTGDTLTTIPAPTENTATINTTTDYSALADTFRMGNEEGRFLDARTGKSIKITVDPQTGVRTNVETGEPVWRYVDKRTWWVYGGDDWDTMGEAKMDEDKGTITYQGEGDVWMTYDERWKAEDEQKMKDWKSKEGDVKIKVGKDGDIKVKDENGKVKYDADDKKVKSDDK